MPELSDKTMRWVVIGFICLVGIAYFVWLTAVYAKFVETNRRVGAMAEEYYTMDKPATVKSTVVDDD